MGWLLRHPGKTAPHAVCGACLEERRQAPTGWAVATFSVSNTTAMA